jgi:hypothetical protein
MCKGECDKMVNGVKGSFSDFWGVDLGRSEAGMLNKCDSGFYEERITWWASTGIERFFSLRVSHSGTVVCID